MSIRRYLSKIFLGSLMVILSLSMPLIACQAANQTDHLIFNGIPRYDDEGNVINAHGACIVEDEGKYYLFGEWKSDSSNSFRGFSCYSSTDLVHWHFERIALGVQKDGIMGPNRVGERVKVMKCQKTGEYVMYMHSDNMSYKDPQVAYATCDKIDGEYIFRGPILYDGQPIRKWDMGTFQDTDGKGYLLIHHGIIYRLSDDYRSAEAKVLDGLKNGGESPAMFKKDGGYFLLGSGLTGWERNDNFYFTARSIEGPWTKQGLFAPEGSLTHNSQTTFVFPFKKGDDVIPMYMGDRWSYPYQASCASYVWLPMVTEGEKLSIPEFWESWNPLTCEKEDVRHICTEVDYTKISFHNSSSWNNGCCRFSCDETDGYIEIPFHGTQLALIGQSNDSCSYARISIFDSENKVVKTSFVDFYSKVPHDGIRYLTPMLPKGKYTLRVEVTGISQEWVTKKGIRYGNNGFNVNIDKVLIFE